jgi:putative transposase
MQLAYKHTYRKNLPHIQPPGATLFVTFRLAGTLPQHVAESLCQEAEMKERQIQQTADPLQRDRLLYEEHKRQFARYDALLDSCAHGPTWLQRPEIAQMVQSSLHFLDQKLVELDVYTLMSNHGHVVFTPLEDGNGGYIALPRIMHSFKRFTAAEANKLLQRRGQFWQHESYDHVVRDEAELERIRRYVLQNSVKAVLVEDEKDWPYSWAKWW